MKKPKGQGGREITGKSIQRIFSDVPGTYEMINHVLTFGMDILWRRKAAGIAAAEGGQLWLDVCSGTGEMAMYLSRLAGWDARVIAADFSLPMLRKISEKPEGSRILFTLADATSLPFPDGTFDLITVSLATRNLNVRRENLNRCFREFHRVLKPGGRFVNLETSQPPSGLLRKLFHSYVSLVVRPAGSFLSGSRSGYAYLAYTIPRFYQAPELADILRQAGFARVSYTRMQFGMAAVHKAVKGPDNNR